MGDLADGDRSIRRFVGYIHPNETMIGLGFDVHRLAEGESLWLGGVEIPSDIGTVAHSDGDVVLHALVDAMLGALALGDIGEHFPDTDEKWKGASSGHVRPRGCENDRG